MQLYLNDKIASADEVRSYVHLFSFFPVCYGTLYMAN